MSLPVLNDVCGKHGCAACCHDTEMPITEEDAARLAALGHDRAVFSRVDPADKGLYLANVAGACHFLKDERCSVYADRPVGCRIYPWVMTEDGKLVRDEDCPHRAEFPVVPGTLRRIQKIAAVLSREAGKR